MTGALRPREIVLNLSLGHRWHWAGGDAWQLRQGTWAHLRRLGNASLERRKRIITRWRQAHRQRDASAAR